MIDFSGYTYDAILKNMLSKVPREIDTREGSMIQTAVGPIAWYLEGMYMVLAQIQENAYGETAVGQALDYICAERNIYRKKAIPAVREGIFNTEVPEGALFKTINGANAVNFVSGKFRRREEEDYVYELTCEKPGIMGNFYIGPILPVTTVSGLTHASVGEVLISGAEEENDDSLRARYKSTFDMEAFGGNITAYRNAILSMEGVGAVQVYPVWDGGGTVLCSILNSQLKPADEGLVCLVQNEICPAESGEIFPSGNGYGMAPVGAKVTVVSASELVLNIHCTLQLSVTNSDVTSYEHVIRQKIQEYLHMVCKTWGSPLRTYKVEYPVAVYISRIIAAVLTISDIVNVTDVEVNGSAEDLMLTETPQLQQLPVLGEVILHGR